MPMKADPKKITSRLCKPRLWLGAVLLGLVGSIAAFGTLDTLFPLDRDRLYKPQATRVYDRHQRLVRMHLSADGFWRFRADPQEIPAVLSKAVITFEDRFFHWHCGVNPLSLARAAVHNLRHERLTGGSTITMQVARMMHRRPRTLTSKVVEIFNALQLEWHFSKAEILNFYLNLAPFGGNVEGVAAAARIYFDKPLKALSTAEIAVLTTVPKNPNANRPDRAVHLAAKRRRVIRTLERHAVITPDQALRAMAEPLLARRHAPVFTAPHFTDRVQAQSNLRPRIDTTLDRGLYAFVKQRLAEKVEQLAYLKVHNAAAVVIHNPSL